MESTWVLGGGGGQTKGEEGLWDLHTQIRPSLWNYNFAKTKRSQIILNFNSEMLLASTCLGQVYQLRPTYYISKYLKIVNQNKHINVFCAFTLPKYFKNHTQKTPKTTPPKNYSPRRPCSIVWLMKSFFKWQFNIFLITIIALHVDISVH